MPKPRSTILLREDDPRFAEAQACFKAHRPDEGRALLREIQRTGPQTSESFEASGGRKNRRRTP